MLDLDVDEILEVNYLDAPTLGQRDAVELIFKNGEKQVYSGPEFAEVIEILKHWTPPTA